MNRPKISVCMPIYNRNRFLPLIISNLLSMDYPLENIELVMDDDGTEPFINDNNTMAEFKEIIKPIQFSYYKNRKKRTIGEKRNNLCKLSKNKIIAFMDSDDIYMSDYLSHSMDTMKKTKKTLVGSNQMLFIYPLIDWKMTGIQCGEKRMIHEATMVFTKQHWKSCGGFKKNSMGEGIGMVDGMNLHRVGLTDIQHIMICVCHQDNTIPKERFRDNIDIGNQLTEYDVHLLKRCLHI